MKKINNISAIVFKILGLLKVAIPILTLTLAYINSSSIATFVIRLLQNTYTILQTIIFFIAIVMIINCISTKSKAWKYYLISIFIIIIEYYLPENDIIILLERVYAGYLYYYAGVGIKYVLKQENTTINLTKKIKITNYIYLSILLTTFTVFQTSRIILNITKKKEQYDINQIIPEPIQKETTGTRIIENNGKQYTINFIAEYTLTGRVVTTYPYFNNSTYSKLIPLDIGVIWGEAALEKNYKKTTYFSDGTRSLNFYCTNMSTCQNHELSNNHLLPENKKIKREIFLIKPGDYIKIEGYLIEITGSDYSQRSSTTRNDTGDGACEIIYVTNITWLTDKK